MRVLKENLSIINRNIILLKKSLEKGPTFTECAIFQNLFPLSYSQCFSSLLLKKTWETFTLFILDRTACSGFEFSYFFKSLPKSRPYYQEDSQTPPSTLATSGKQTAGSPLSPGQRVRFCPGPWTLGTAIFSCLPCSQTYLLPVASDGQDSSILEKKKKDMEPNCYTST